MPYRDQLHERLASLHHERERLLEENRLLEAEVAATQEHAGRLPDARIWPGYTIASVVFAVNLLVPGPFLSVLCLFALTGSWLVPRGSRHAHERLVPWRGSPFPPMTMIYASGPVDVHTTSPFTIEIRSIDGLPEATVVAHVYDTPRLGNSLRGRTPRELAHITRRVVRRALADFKEPGARNKRVLHELARHSIKLVELRVSPS